MADRPSGLIVRVTSYRGRGAGWCSAPSGVGGAPTRCPLGLFVTDSGILRRFGEAWRCRAGTRQCNAALGTRSWNRYSSSHVGKRRPLRSGQLVLVVFVEAIDLSSSTMDASSFICIEDRNGRARLIYAQGIKLTCVRLAGGSRLHVGVLRELTCPRTRTRRPNSNANLS